MKGLLSFKNNSFGAVKDVDTKSRVITGYLSNFDNIDSDNDVMVKGAFKKSINERRNQIYFLNQHNFAQPHGRFSVLTEDAKGLYFESEPLINTTYSEDALKLYQAGIMKEHSIGFVTMQKEQKSGVRYLQEVKLYEGSNVTLGSNADTPFTGFKSLTLKDTNEKISLILKFFKNGNVTDDTFNLLELSLKDLQKHAFELGKMTLKNGGQPLDNTSQNVKPLLNIINEFI